MESGPTGQWWYKQSVNLPVKALKLLANQQKDGVSRNPDFVQQASDPSAQKRNVWRACRNFMKVSLIQSLCPGRGPSE